MKGSTFVLEVKQQQRQPNEVIQFLLESSSLGFLTGFQSLPVLPELSIFIHGQGLVVGKEKPDQFSAGIASISSKTMSMILKYGDFKIKQETKSIHIKQQSLKSLECVAVSTGHTGLWETHHSLWKAPTEIGLDLSIMKRLMLNNGSIWLCHNAGC